MQESAAAAAAVVVGHIRRHIDEVFFADHLFYDIAKIFGNRITIGLSDKLAWILNSEGDLEVLIPVRIDWKFSFAYPFCVILDDAGNFKFIGDVEFFQSGPDCKEFVASFRVEPHLATQILHSFCLDSDDMFPGLIISEKHTVVFSCPSLGAVGPVGINLVKNLP